METYLSYTDSLKNDSICTGRLYIGYLRMLCYSCQLRLLVSDNKVAPDTPVLENLPGINTE